MNFLPVTRYSLLFTRYSLLLTRYSLLFTRYFTTSWLLVTTFLLFIRQSLLLTRYSLFYFSFVTTYSLLITFYSLFLFINFYYLLVKLWKLNDVKNLNISQYASNLHIERLREFQNLFQLSIINFKSPETQLNQSGKLMPAHI